MTRFSVRLFRVKDSGLKKETILSATEERELYELRKVREQKDTFLITFGFFSGREIIATKEGTRMKNDRRGSIKKLKKLARLKEYAPIHDRLMAIVYDKKSGPPLKLLNA